MKTNNIENKLNVKNWFKNEIGLVFSIFVIIFIMIQSSDWYLTSIVIDDALYYPIVARNIVEGNGSTFDNITKTNGYHPLWMIINIPFMLLSGDSYTRLFIFKLIVCLIVLLMALVFRKLLKELNFDKISISIFLCLFICSYFWSVKVYFSGMETPLVTLFIGISMLYLIKISKKGDTNYYILLGLFLSFTFLARLDSIFFAICVYIFLLFKYSFKEYRKILISGMTFSIIVAPYLILNYLNFGNIIPVSGLKKSFDNPSDAIFHNLNKAVIFFSEEFSRISQNIFLLIGFTVIVIIFISLFFVSLKKYKKLFSNNFQIYIPLFFATIAHLIYNFLIMKEITVNWYQYFIFLSIYLMVAILFNELSHKLILFKKYFLLVLIIVSIFQFNIANSKYPRDYRIKAIEVANYIKKTNNDNIYAMIDPGVLRFVSGTKIIALNGLIGDNIMLKDLRYLDRNDFFKKYGVNYHIQINKEKNYYDTTRYQRVFKTDYFRYGTDDSCFIDIQAIK